MVFEMQLCTLCIATIGSRFTLTTHAAVYSFTLTSHTRQVIDGLVVKLAAQL